MRIEVVELKISLAFLFIHNFSCVIECSRCLEVFFFIISISVHDSHILSHRPPRFVQLARNRLYYDTKYKVRKTKFSVSLNQFSGQHTYVYHTSIVYHWSLHLNLFVILLCYKVRKVGNTTEPNLTIPNEVKYYLKYSVTIVADDTYS